MTKTKLSDISTRAPEKFSKEKVKKEIQKLKFRLEELQNLLYAESKHALLVVMQGMDASGKDGAVKNVFEAAISKTNIAFLSKMPSFCFVIPQVFNEIAYPLLSLNSLFE